MTDLVQCQRQPYQRSYASKVIACTQTSSQTQTDKKKSREEKKQQEQTYDVQLEDTILYPEGGGQPCDYGVLNGSVSVSSVCTRPDGVVVHTVNQPLDAGSEVSITLDWERRYDHMQQHSAQHLISALFIKQASMPTLSWWLASRPNECHIELDTADILDNTLLHTVEQQANAVIRAATSIHTHTYPSVNAALDDPIFVSKLPTHKVLGDHLKGTVRVIEIDGVDMNPCGGTHLRNTAEMQLIHLTRYDKQRGHVRVFFLAGDRALQALTIGLDTQRQLSALLSIGVEGHVETVKKLQLEQRALSKANTKYSRELAELQGQALVTQALNTNHGSTSTTTPVVLLYHRDDSTTAFLSVVGDTFATTLSASASSSLPYLLFLTCSDAPESKQGQYVLLGNQASVVAPEVATILEGRGGGKGNKVQGKASRIDKREEAYKAIQAKVAGVATNS